MLPCERLPRTYTAGDFLLISCDATGRGSGFVAVEIPFTPRAKRVLELSLEEARQLGDLQTVLLTLRPASDFQLLCCVLLLPYLAQCTRTLTMLGA